VIAEWGDGVADDVARSTHSLAGTLLLGLLVFAVGATAGFLARLLWPRPR
jgi:hypothetical protein